MIIHCDNMGTVAVVNSGYSKAAPVMHLLRSLFFLPGHVFNLRCKQCIHRGSRTLGQMRCPEITSVGSCLRSPMLEVRQSCHSEESGSTLAGPTHQLEISELDTTVQQLFINGLAPSTSRNYQSGSKRFITFCNLYHVSFPFPVNEQLLSRFVAYLFKEGVKGSTIKNYMAAVRHAQISMGLDDPRMSDMPQLGYIIRGIKRVTGGPPRTKLPITPDLMRRSWSLPTDRNGAMLWAAACMCFFSFLRCGEVVISLDASYNPQVNLSLEDVRVDSQVKPSYVEVNIKASKTDPFRQGVRVYLGATSRDICPVSAILHYLALRGTGPGPHLQV